MFYDPIARIRIRVRVRAPIRDGDGGRRRERTNEMSGDPNGTGGGGAGVVARTDDDAANANAGRSLLACPKSWQLYFPDVTHDFSDRRAELARTMTNFFASTRGREFVKEVRRDGNAVTTMGGEGKDGEGGWTDETV
jgi:hypothetical protein